MTKMKSMNNRISIVLCLVLMLLAAAKLSAFAAELTPIPDLRDEEGTLTIETKYTDEDNVTQISGMELVVYKVADFIVKSGNPRFVLTEDFKDVDVDFDGMTAEDSIDAANLFYEVVTAKKLEGTKAVSQNGYASFGKVSHGMYLVTQTGATGQAENYSGLDPYLVMVPQPVPEIDPTDWEYDVVSIPKMVLGTYEPPGDEEKEPPKDDEVKNIYEKETKVKGTKTGDYTNVYIWVALILIVLSALVIAHILRRRSRN